MKAGLVTASVLGALALAAALSFDSANAGHEHWLETPGMCVTDLGSGQTSISDPAAGGYHQIHENVHLGTPGSFAFQQANNPVSIGKVDPVACP